MFFFFSKIFYFFLVPLHWIVALLLWSIFAKKTILKRRLQVAAVILLFLFGNEFILNKLINAWQNQPVTLPSSTIYSAGIVLGGYESFDRNGNGFFNSSADRFIQTLQLYRQKHIAKIVVSGSRVEGGEVVANSFVEQQFLKMGVPPGDLIVDNRSMNTFENARFSKSLLDSAGLHPPYVLITSSWHMPRAELVFKKAEMPIVPYPCNYVFVPKKFKWHDFLLPKAMVLDQWAYFLKELAGIVAYKLFNKA